MDTWERLSEEGISNIDYVHSQKVWEVFEMKNLGEYHDLHVQIHTLLLANFRTKCIEIYELDPALFCLHQG